MNEMRAKLKWQLMKFDLAKPFGFPELLVVSRTEFNFEGPEATMQCQESITSLLTEAN